MNLTLIFSAFGSIIYSYVTFLLKEKKQKPNVEKDTKLSNMPDVKKDASYA
jgi:hypothetical protein